VQGDDAAHIKEAYRTHLSHYFQASFDKVFPEFLDLLLPYLVPSGHVTVVFKSLHAENTPPLRFLNFTVPLWKKIAQLQDDDRKVLLARQNDRNTMSYNDRKRMVFDDSETLGQYILRTRPTDMLKLTFYRVRIQKTQFDRALERLLYTRQLEDNARIAAGHRPYDYDAIRERNSADYDTAIQSIAGVVYAAADAAEAETNT
jgi:hypothetical protein